MFFLFFAFFSVLFSGKLFNKACGTISIYRPNMMSVIFYYYFIVQNVIGAILVVNQLDDHYMINKLQYSTSRIYGYYAIMYSMVAFPLGMLLANIIFKRNNVNKKLEEYVNKGISSEIRYKDKTIKSILIFLSLMSAISVLYVLFIIKDIPLLKLFNGGSALDLALFRGDVSRNFQGNEYVKNMFALCLTPFLSYVAYGYKKIKNSFVNKCWFYVMFFFSFLILTYDLSKSPLIVYLLGYLFFYVYMGGKLSKKLLLFVLCAVFLLLIFLYSVLMDNTEVDLSSLFYYNSGIIGRLILSSSEGLFFSFDLFPHNYKYIDFSSISYFLSDMFNLNYSDRSARLIMEYINPSGVKEGVAGVANALFIGEAWANWGLVGVLISPIYVGFVIQSLYLFILHSPKTPFFLALLIFYSFNSAMTGGVNEYFYNIQALFMGLIMFFVYGGSLVLNKIK